MPPHWYRIYYGECPRCGNSVEYRKRIYTPRPPDMLDRYERLSYAETYDGCL
jgi:hypothetical protein